MAPVLPVVRVVGPGRNVGKTWLAARLIERFTARGYEVVAVKRSHHAVVPDRSGSDSDRFAAAGARVVVFGGSDGTLVRAPRAERLEEVTSRFAGTADLVIVEGFAGDALGTQVAILPDPPAAVRVTTMDGRALAIVPLEDVEAIVSTLEGELGLCAAGDQALRAALRRAGALHGHRCPGLVLGVRMALAAARHLGVALPAGGALMVHAETARCATDALAAVTGCTLGAGTLTVTERGKLAATFTHQPTARAVRAIVRADLREVARARVPHGSDRAAQELAYRTLPDEVLFEVCAVPPRPAPVRARGHAVCAGCGEEVASAFKRTVAGRVLCSACAALDAPAAALARGIRSASRR